MSQSRFALSPRLLIASAVLFLSAAPVMRPVPASAASLDPSPAALTAEIEQRLAAAQEILDGILAGGGERTAANTLDPLNRLAMEVDGAAAKASLLENVHPDPAVRKAAEEGTQKVSAFTTALSLNRALYEALAAVKADGLDARAQRFLAEELRDYRRAGVDKDEATREKVKALQEKAVEIGQEFQRNIRDGRRTLYIGGPEELDGLPADYIAAHPPGEDGRIAITTEYPDYTPVMTYAKNGELRRKLYLEFTNRAYPENEEVLGRLLAVRHELAQTLGYASWADYVTEDKMTGSAAAAAEFLAKLDAATRKRAEEDYALLLARKRADDPGAAEVYDWEKAYYQELVKAERFDFDSQILRAYYNYPQVKSGIMDVCAKLFGVEFRPVADAQLWHPTVECYDMYEAGAHKGRLYLDMHPREGKYSHAAQFTLTTGVEGVQIPEGVLVCNFPEPDASGLGLMEHDDVETFFHEFGHLLHHLFGGHQKWLAQSGVATEWDFVEAPSQLLQEWALDARTLSAFARHHETGEPIPAELIAKLRASVDYGNGLYVRQQTFYSAISLNAYNRPPDQVDFATMVPELQAKYASFSYVPGAHMYASFGHLNGYSAIYYTYMWSLVIAKDLFSRFDAENLMDPATATAYRRAVLDAGGTKDAADLVKDFLGRPYGFESFERWLSGAR